MSQTRVCRIAHQVTDMDHTVAAFEKVLGFRYEFVDVGDFPLRVAIGEHGFEPLQLTGDFNFDPIEPPFLEVALAVADAEAVKTKLEAAGYKVQAPNYLPATDTWEYLFGPEFHGIPVMIANEGDQEASLSPGFKTLEDAAPAKLGCCTLVVDNVDKVAADMNTFFDMDFVDTDTGGFAAKAKAGRHRVRLVENGNPALTGEFRACLASLDVMVDDVESARKSLEDAGCRVLHERTLSSGNKAYYFGAQFEGLPLGIYSASDDAEILGGA
ncbi:MAG: hypothetical protein CMK32_10945 [Porticoccaceae bacterium]|nr:hypothetical protein [Porticoccaceae bacterium]